MEEESGSDLVISVNPAFSLEKKRNTTKDFSHDSENSSIDSN
jgi:hypothetical protein